MSENYKWPPFIPELGDYVKEYIDGQNPLSIADESGIIKDLEDNFARLHKRKFALTVSSGTMALYSAYFAINLKPDDEVICTVFSFHATATPLLHLGVRIVFCDVEEETGNIDSSKIEALITKKTKAIVTNDQWGHPCDKAAIVSICKKYALYYIEDCSHAHFAEYNGRCVGTFGDAACFSLQGQKLISGGEGGILLTDNQDIYERAVLLGHNLKRPAQSVITEAYKPLARTGFGLKLRMHPLAALIANYQLCNYCFDWIRDRKTTLEYFEKSLEGTFLTPMVKKEYVSSMGAWYGFMPLIRKEFSVDRLHFVQWMNEKGLEVSIPKSEPISNYELFSTDKFPILNYMKQPVGEYPQALAYYSSIVRFPTYSAMEYQKIDRYISEIRNYMREVIS